MWSLEADGVQTDWDRLATAEFSHDKETAKLELAHIEARDAVEDA
jgi:hypothetical protein